MATTFILPLTAFLLVYRRTCFVGQERTAHPVCSEKCAHWIVCGFSFQRVALRCLLKITV